ncbi:MAG: general secretion pathway protein GspA [Gammaproteobacteria bacterium]|nr:MAG: general secretion pathway protein GspA [Gammaproteobacteria bacterium]
MYQAHFGLDELPFTLAPDPAYLYCHRGQQEALNVVLVALALGEGFVKITGEVGTGKTLLCRALLERLAADYETAYLPNPYLSPAGLRRALAEELGIDSVGQDEHALLKRLTERLIALNAAGRPVVVLLDEVQAMPDQTLEALRLLSNLETEKGKLLHLVLFGQPELDEKLARPRNRQLRQRIVHAYRLAPLDRGQVGHYLEHRLRVAGYRGEPLFTPAAVECIHRASGGIPRLVNILANKSLLLAYGKGVWRVDAALARQAAADTEGVEVPAGPWRRVGWALGLAGAVLGVWWMWSRL